MTVASSVKFSVGTPLGMIDGVSEDARQRLAAVSVTTAEELLGILRADRAGTERLLPSENIARLESDAAAVASASAAPDLDEAPDEVFFTGAEPPEFVGDTTVELDDIERRLATGDLEKAIGPAGTGADLRACFGPVRYQGRRGTCVAHAVCALVECLKQDSTGPDLSEQHLYWNAKQHDGRPNASGTTIAVAMERMIADGVCPEDVWPYRPEPMPGDEAQGPPPSSAASSASGHRLVESEGLQRHDSATIRAALDARRPVALSVPVYPNWEGNEMLKLSGFIPMPLPGSSNTNGHAMCAVGYRYDDQFTGGGFFVLRNSWGTGFAPSSPIAPGHALLPFSYWDDYGWEVFVGKC